MDTTVGMRIKNLRIDKRITQQALADIINMSRPAIAKYENDLIQPSFDVLIKLADVFECSTDYLLGRVTSENKKISIEHNENVKFTESEMELILKAAEILKEKGSLTKYIQKE